MCKARVMSFVLILTLAQGARADTPSIRFTSVPEYGTAERLYGEVGNVVPTNYRVAVYIFVEGWWTKPTFDSPLTSIAADGKWDCAIVTGGYDQYAIRIAAYLMPLGVDPPLMNGGTVLPSIPEAVASTQVDRSHQAKFLYFADRKWKVKTTDFPAGPGPNYYSDSEQDVWVDSSGLHLTVSYHDNRWNCTEVILQESLGYGTYALQIYGRIDTIDPAMVAGAFTWDEDAPQASYRELDVVEFSRWADPNEQRNAQYVVQPWNDARRHRFNVSLSSMNQDLTCYLIWGPGRAQFKTYLGKYVGKVPSEDKLLEDWTYSGDEVPLCGNENVRMNLWLYNGMAPMNGQGGQFTITDFSYSPKYGPETVQFKELPQSITTNLPRYPVAGYYDRANRVSIDVESFAPGDLSDQIAAYHAEPGVSDGGFRYDADLSVGTNILDLTIFSGTQQLDHQVKEIVYSPSFSTKKQKLLYDSGVVIDLDNCYVLGLSPEFTALTNRGDYVIDAKGNVYSTSSHYTARPPLMFANREAGVYPVFSADDVFCYARNEKVRFSDGTVVSGSFPVSVDNRSSSLLQDNRLAVSSGSFSIVDLSTDRVLISAPAHQSRVYRGGANVDPTGVFGITTSYSWACGVFDVTMMDTGAEVFQSDTCLPDFMGQVAFSKDGRFAFIGGCGNPSLGWGGVYVYDLGAGKVADFYGRHGATSVAVCEEGYIYISTYDGNHRGVDVLKMNGESKLVFVRSFFTNMAPTYPPGRTLLIKPRIR